VKTFIKVAIGASTIAALSFGPSAAFAVSGATLPAGETIYQANYSENPSALWSTAADGTATVIGTPATSGIGDTTDGAYNAATGKSYVVGKGYDGPCTLWEADVTTGQFTRIARITGAEGDTHDCDAFDIAPDGTAWITMYDEQASTNTGTLAQLNLTDGTTSNAVSITGMRDGISWIAIHPTSGVVYAGDFRKNLFTLNAETGALSIVALGADLDLAKGYNIYDAAFDSAGLLWLTAWDEGTELFTADVSDFAATLSSQGMIQIEGSGANTGTDSLWITHAVAVPELASTGFDASAPLTFGFGILGLGMATFMIRRARRA